jgi:hypothetical protein
MEAFRLFIQDLAKQLAVGNFKVKVISGDKEFDAVVTGYDEQYGTIAVRFDSDTLTQPENVEVTAPSFGYDMESKPTYVVKQVPVKNMNVYPKYIKLNLVV